MSHAVRYHVPGGEVHFEDVESLDAAVALVELLRNDEGLEDVRVYEHVPIQFEPYYRVVLDDQAARPSHGGTADPGSAGSGGANPGAAGPTAAEAVGDEPADETDVAPPPGSMPLTPPAFPADV